MNKHVEAELETSTRRSLTRTRCGVVLGICASLFACSTENRDRKSPAEIAEEREDFQTGFIQEAVVVTGPSWEDNFTTFKATVNTPAAPFTSHNWYIQQHFKPNMEIQEYENRVCNNTASTSQATGVVVDSTAWGFCIVDDGAAVDGKALQIRAKNVGGYIHSGRINSKRFVEFKPTASEGIRTTVRLRMPVGAHGGGFWPAVWFLQNRIAEAPVISDGDNANWPCEGAHEVDLFEYGSLGGYGASWGPTYNKSSMHYRNGTCIAQSVQNTLGSEVYNDTMDDGVYQTYAMELDTKRARFYRNGVQYGPQHDVTGLKFDENLFWIMNVAAGGSLGGTVNWSAFNADTKSIFIDYVKVEKFNPNPAPSPRSIAGNLEAETHDVMQGMTAEACSEGGQDLGYIDAGDYVDWYVNVPTTGDYVMQSRSAVNNPGGNAAFRVRVDGVDRGTKTMTPTTHGWQSWQTHTSASFPITAGNHWIRFEAVTGKQNLNWVKLVQQANGTCTDGVKNQNETGIDCGGSCAACPTCSDGVKNQSETGVDCGGPCNACTTTPGNPGGGTTTGSTLQAEHGFQGGSTTIENGGTTVGFFDAGDHIRFDGVVMDDVVGVDIRLSGANSGGVLELRTHDSDDGATAGYLVDSYTMTSTGAWTTWQERRLNFDNAGQTGAKKLFLVGKSGSGIMNIDWIRLVTSDNSSGGGTGYNVALANNSFTNGTAGWSSYFFHPGGSLTQEGGTWGRLNLTTANGNYWHNQLFQVVVTDGGTYTMKFFFQNAEGASKTVQPICEMNASPYTRYVWNNGAFSDKFCTNSGSAWMECTATCKPPKGVSVKFGLFAGQDATDVRLDDFTLTTDAGPNTNCAGGYCCATSCTNTAGLQQCGGTGCANMPGGAASCCTGNIQASGVSCAGNPSTNAPCIQ